MLASFQVLESIACRAHTVAPARARIGSAKGNLLADAEGNEIGDRRKKIREKAFSAEKLTRREKHLQVVVVVVVVTGEGASSALRLLIMIIWRVVMH
jgi:hypothetical protein